MPILTFCKTMEVTRGRFCLQESILTFCKTEEVNRVNPHLSKKNIQVNGASPGLSCACPGAARVGWLGFTSMAFKHVVLSRALVGSLPSTVEKPYK